MAAVDPTLEALYERLDREEAEHARLESDLQEFIQHTNELREQAEAKAKRVATLRTAIQELGGDLDEPEPTPEPTPEPIGPGWLLDDDDGLESDEQEVPDPEPVEDEPEPKNHGFTGKGHAVISAAFRDWVVANKGLTFTAAEVSEETGISEGSVRKLFKEFLRTGLIEEDRRRYSRNDKRGSGAKPMAYKYRVKKDGPKSRREVSGGPAVDVGLPAAPSRKGRAPTGRKLKISDPETRKLVDAATAAGWTLSNGGAHLRLESPQGRVVIVSKTPSDHRAVNNTRAELRRAGLGV